MQDTIKLVIVDDHDILREGIKARLADQDGIAILAEGANGQEAIDLYERLQPDILLSDVSMPKINGLEAAAQILSRFPKAKIIFLSVYDDPEYVKEAMRIGAKGFVLKDLSKIEMLQAIKQVAAGGTYIAGRVAKSLTAPDPDINFTKREKEVLQQIAKGLSNKEIASVLNLSVRTVESHRSSIREKSGGGNAARLTKLASEMGLS